MPEFSISRGPQRAAIAAGLLGMTAFLSDVLLVRLPQSEPPQELSSLWILAVGFVAGTLGAAGAWLVSLVAAEAPELAIRLLAALFSGSLVSVAILAAASRGGAGLFAGGCVSSLGIISGFSHLAIRGWGWPAATAATETSKRDLPHDRATSTISPPDPTSDTGSSLERPSQTWRRWIEAGRDILEGCVTVHFEPGQATAIVHVPLQPSMQSTPDVEAEPVDSGDLLISADPVLPYGVRLVCRRMSGINAAWTTSAAVQISAACQAVRAA